MKKKCEICQWLKLEVTLAKQTASRYRVERNALSRRLKKALKEIERLKEGK